MPSVARSGRSFSSFIYSFLNEMFFLIQVTAYGNLFTAGRSLASDVLFIIVSQTLIL
jgi:hypothetical protein